MAINFPSSPSDGQIYTDTTSGNAYRYNAAIGAWKISAAAISGALVLLEQHTASNSASLDFTSCFTSAYDRYVIELISMVVGTNAASLGIQVSTDGGASFIAGTNYFWSYYATLVGGASSGGGGAGSTSRMQLFEPLLSSATPNFSATLEFFDPLNASVKKILTGRGQGIFSTDLGLYGFQIYGFYNAAAAVNAIRIAPSSGVIASGVARVYGVAK